MKDVTDATFQADVVERSKQLPVVVDLWAPWCGPCKTLGPTIEKVVNETEGRVELAKVNVDENPAISQAFRVQSIPAVFALKDGKVVDTFVGALPETAVREFVSKLAPVTSPADLLAATGLVPAKGRARTTIDQGGAYVNNRRVGDVGRVVCRDDLVAGRYVVLRRGKKDHHLVRFE
jgi:putative thioredoxin